MLRESIKIDKWLIGNKGEYMDFEIFKGSRFYSCGKVDIKLHQKKRKQISYLPYHSGHTEHSVSNYVIDELKRYIWSNTKEIDFLGIKVKFYELLPNRG